MEVAKDRTRALIARELGISLTETADDYRAPSGEMLDGDWLGAFAQPSVVLNKVTPVSLAIAGTAGHSVDEYGEAALEVAQLPGARVEIVKRYAGRGPSGHFRYVGRLDGGTLAGYWESLVRPEFAGVFWWCRAERIEQPGADRLRARVRKTSPRKNVLLGSLVAAAIATRIYPPMGLAALAVFAPAAYLLHRRKLALRAEVEAWRTEASSRH